jgi:hypothetical protein
VARLALRLIASSLIGFYTSGVYALDTCQGVFTPVNLAGEDLRGEFANLKIEYTKSSSSALLQERTHEFLIKVQGRLQSLGTDSELKSYRGQQVLGISSGHVPGTLGRVAQQIQKKYGYGLIYHPRRSIEMGSLGFASSVDRVIGVSLDSVLSGFSDSTLLHEIRHMRLSSLRSQALIDGDGEVLLFAQLRTLADSEFPTVTGKEKGAYKKNILDWMNSTLF